MSEDETMYELIEGYLNGSLTAAEREAFEKEIVTRPDLQHQIGLHRMVRDLVVENRLLEVKQILSVQRSAGLKPAGFKYIAWGALSILLIVGISLYRPQLNTARKNSDTSKALSRPATEPKHAPSPEKYPEPADSEFVLKEKKPYEPEEENFPPLHEENIIPQDSQQLDRSEQPPPSELPEPVEKTVPVIPIDPCLQHSLEAHVGATAACEGEEDGAILISRISGGYSPYKVFIKDEKNELQHSYLRLAPGTYEVEIKDSKGCSRKFENVIVKSKVCSKDYSFNPYIGELWEVPAETKDGRLFIYHESGQTWHEQELTAGGQETWSGQSKNGEITPGYFIFVIKYKDGAQIQGSVTIVR